MNGIVQASDLAGENLWSLLHDEFARKKAAQSRWNRKVGLAFDWDGDDAPDDQRIADVHKHWMGRIGMALAADYPGHGEMACIETEFHGILRITLPPLVTSPDGVIVNLKDVDPVATARKYFGELLERLRLERARFYAADLRRAVQGRSIVDIRNGVLPT